MNDDDQEKSGQPQEQPTQSDDRIDLSEHGQRGIDVRPTADPQAVSAPPMGGLAPVEAAPAGSQDGGQGQTSSEKGSGGGSDSGE